MTGKRAPGPSSDKDTEDGTIARELRAAIALDDRERLTMLHAMLEMVSERALGPRSLTVEILQLVGDRWSALILEVLAAGSFRPSELQRVVGIFSRIGNSNSISQRVLTAKLRSYERLGLVRRTMWHTIPPRTDYSLTPLGHELAGMIRSMVQWGLDNDPAITAAIQAYRDAGDD